MSLVSYVPGWNFNLLVMSPGLKVGQNRNQDTKPVQLHPWKEYYNNILDKLHVVVASCIHPWHGGNLMHVIVNQLYSEHAHACVLCVSGGLGYGFSGVVW